MIRFRFFPILPLLALVLLAASPMACCQGSGSPPFPSKPAARGKTPGAPHPSSLPPRGPLPLELAESARLAVLALGREVLKGNYRPSLEKMYPRWKKRAAKRVGGMPRLEEQMARVVRRMKDSGISIVAYRASMPRSAFEVWPTAEKKVIRGERKLTGKMAYRDWVVFVPTKTRYRKTDPGTGKTHLFDLSGFQIAVSTKGTREWHFIDGSSISTKELRALFPSLPADEKALRLPLRKGQAVR